VKIYQAINEEDNLLYEREYVGYENKNYQIVLTHVVSSDRVVQLTNPIVTSEVNLELIGDNANIGLNHNAKAVKRVRGNQ
jgi:hypothetical protein